jgi:signal transduction histidine kinase
MPGMSGIETLAMIRTQARFRDLPVIMVSAISEEDGVGECLQGGASDYIVKPVDAPVAAARIRSHVERRRAVESLRSLNADFRRQVAERTADLERINDTLRGEIVRRRELEVELREAMQRAESANRAKSDFLTAMSHELRTPLNSIIGFSDLIKLQAASPDSGDRIGEYAAYINDGGNHLLGIVNDILDLSKIDVGRTELNETHVRIDDLIDRSIRMVSVLADRRVTVRVDPALDGLELFCDEVLLRRALVNLLGNAAKFSEPDSEIVVEAVSGDGGDVAISVADEGCGIAEADVPKVLEPFGQVNSDMARRHVGTGLGVPLTKSLAELHGGGFRIESRPGEGTTVTITLPAARLAARDGRIARLAAS